MSNILIGTGFYANDDNFAERMSFFQTWRKVNLPDTDDAFVVVNNSETGPKSINACCDFDNLLKRMPVEHIRIYNNLGHVGSWLNKPDAPQLLGWSMSWILPALIAYSERKDFIYLEQDALAFGNWLEVILDDVQKKGLNVAIGECPANIAACEQSLFWIRWQWIPEFVAEYMAISASDARDGWLPEDKFVKLMMNKPILKIGYHSLPCGRGRPLPYDAPAWYAQKFTAEELEELKKRGMI